MKTSLSSHRVVGIGRGAGGRVSSADCPDFQGRQVQISKDQRNENNGLYLRNARCVPGTAVRNVPHTNSQIQQPKRSGRLYYFQDEETEACMYEVTCPRLHSPWVFDLELEPRH